MPTEHTIAQGDCVSSIAFDHGLLPETVWMDPGNAALRELRKDMHVLLPGDVLVVPDLREREETRPSDKSHKFRRKGVPEKVQLQFFDEADEPVANCPCTVVVDEVEQKLRTDGDGRIELKILPGAQRATVRFDTEKAEWKELAYEFQLGGLDPVTEDSGVVQRLQNIGCLGEGEALEDGIRAFQRKEGLEETGRMDEQTRSRLQSKSTD